MPLSPSVCCNLTDFGVKRQKNKPRKTSGSPLILINTTFMWEIGCSAEETSNLELLSLTLHVYSLMLLSHFPRKPRTMNSCTTRSYVFLSFGKQRNIARGRRVCLMVTRTHGLINSSFAVLSRFLPSFQLLRQTNFKRNSRTRVLFKSRLKRISL